MNCELAPNFNTWPGEVSFAASSYLCITFVLIGGPRPTWSCTIDFAEGLPLDFYIHVFPTRSLLGAVPVAVTFTAPGYTPWPLLVNATVNGLITPVSAVLSTETRSGAEWLVRYGHRRLD